MEKERIVIIPTYNEVENIQLLIERISFLHLSFDILIVDDNSPDGTSRKVKELQQLFPNKIYLEIREKKQGLGTAYIHGFKKALTWNYMYIFEMDADMSHDPEDLIRLYKTCLEEKYDISIGSRYVKGVNVVNWPIHRVLISYCASKYVEIVTGMPIKDPTAGLVCYRRKTLENLNLDNIKFLGYAFQIEMKYKIWKKKFRHKEVSIIFTDRIKGKSKMSLSIVSEAIFGVIYLQIDYYLSVLGNLFSNLRKINPFHKRTN